MKIRIWRGGCNLLSIKIYILHKFVYKISNLNNTFCSTRLYFDRNQKGTLQEKYNLTKKNPNYGIKKSKNVKNDLILL